ncbi:hypothetical protein LTR85_011759 [Meristemomyces frigidus]|nr:hypothetical protein LTR85_011759 [Meristemomyces frigidus]
MPSLATIVVSISLYAASANAAPYKRKAFTLVQKTVEDATLFKLGGINYLANTQHPAAVIPLAQPFPAGVGEGTNIPVTVLSTNATVVTQAVLADILESYADGDDVFSEDFLEAVYITSSASTPTIDKSALEDLAGMDVRHIVIAKHFASVSGYAGNATIVKATNASSFPPGPYLATLSGASLSLAPVYRVYEDSYRDFLFGIYNTGDGSGNHTSLEVSYPNFGYRGIPVPSRLYFWNDPRPLAGYRVAIKDLFDIKGLKTSGGSQAWAYINEPANATAPSIQRIVDLGGVLVGKFKLAQFASGANPWDWQDEHYPFNPRGDGWLTCSASSSGGGCSIAAYDWLDYAIGSDTGSSMRRPAAVSGTYGNRPSQGMITLERVIPLGGATDTAGVFSRDPHKWAHFAKHWYTPSLHQSSNITGLSALQVPNTDAFPETILYPIDYLPLNNSAAEPILDAFIANMSSLFGMTVKRFNFTATVENATNPAVANLTALADGALDIIDSYTQWVEIAKPLIITWAELFDGRFPPIDSARRTGWQEFNESQVNLQTYNQALGQKSAAVTWYETHLQYSTSESCSESVMLYDIGTGGLPSYREEGLNNSPNASFLAELPPGAVITGASICPLYGCADFTIPIGQVEYYSEVTFHTEMVPVTINMVVKRGCDFVLFNMIEKLADAGVLRSVKTGKTAF